MDITLPLTRTFEPLYKAEYTFTAAKYDETVWQRLLPNTPEGYRYHLAFELAKVEGFRTGYIAIRRAGIIVCIAPCFMTDYQLDSTVQGSVKRITRWLSSKFPGVLSLRLLCVGSPVTDSGKIGLNPEYQFDPEIITTLNRELDLLAAREGASVIAFKDFLQVDSDYLAAPLAKSGFSRVANMPVATNLIRYRSMDEYLATLSKATRKNLRRKLKGLAAVSIDEYKGMPPELPQLYQLYLNCYEHSDLKFEKLTPQFFESIAGLMPEQCRFVLYRAEGKLIGFNMLLHQNGVMIDKYVGMDYALSRKYNFYFLSWLHNIKMCIRDGVHTYQSGQAAYHLKLSLGARLEPTYIYFRHRNWLINPLLKLASRVLAYENFDANLRKNAHKSDSGQLPLPNPEVNTPESAIQP